MFINLKKPCSDWLIEINKCLNKSIIPKIPQNKETEFVMLQIC